MTAASAHPAETAIHPPKVEHFDIEAMTNTDPKGTVRGVDEYRVEPFGMHVVRDVVDHPRIRAIESWLLPRLDLRVTDFFFHPGHERDQDFYLDVMAVEVGDRVWRTEDHYVDLVLRTGREVEVLDIDELLAAVSAELLDHDVAQQALHTAFAAVDGLARHGYRLDRWLATEGAHPVWRRQG